MTQSELKLMYGKIKKANQLLEEQAIKEGIDITSPQYDTLVAKVRNNVLQKNGFTLSQYQSADAQMKADKQKEKDKGDATFKQVMGQVKQLKGEKGEKGDTGEEGIQGEQGVQGEQGERGEKGENGRDGINGLDGKNGKDGRDGRDGRDGVDGQSYNPLDFNAIVEKVSKIPQKEDLEEYVKETVGYSLKASTEIMGMPNFRKLAMGLRNDIDQLQIQVNKGGGGLSRVYTDATLSGSGTASSPLTVIGGGVGAWSTPPESPDGTITVFTVGSSAPTDVVADGTMIFTPDYSYASSQITFINPPVGVVKFR